MIVRAVLGSTEDCSSLPLKGGDLREIATQRDDHLRRFLLGKKPQGLSAQGAAQFFPLISSRPSLLPNTYPRSID
jgi:hypothetical protein